MKKLNVGRFVRVQFDDVGAVDGIITQVDGKNDFRFFNISTRTIEHNNGAPAIKVGKYVVAKESGL